MTQELLPGLSGIGILKDSTHMNFVSMAERQVQMPTPNGPTPVVVQQIVSIHVELVYPVTRTNPHVLSYEELGDVFKMVLKAIPLTFANEKLGSERTLNATLIGMYPVRHAPPVGHSFIRIELKDGLAQDVQVRKPN